MTLLRHSICRGAALGLSIVFSAAAMAKLPAPTPAQVQDAAAKKVQADAQAAKDREALTVTMDTLTQRWRGKAAATGWAVNPPTPIETPSAAVNLPASQSGSSGQPGGQRGDAAQAAPVTSEKAGTAAPSREGK